MTVHLDLTHVTAKPLDIENDLHMCVELGDLFQMCSFFLSRGVLSLARRDTSNRAEVEGGDIA
jgi:hypothetical protein